MSTTSASKPHYLLLDGLRGVASIIVIIYHLGEAFCTSPFDQFFNHGYLAVDFFFILSGFVIGYAYDNRWGEGLSIGGFFKRRLIRLHPMVIVGAVLGTITFIIQGCVQWDGTKITTSAIMLSMLMAMFLVPTIPGARAEIRGNGEMFPINGPSWSLFFEYIGNILYALLLRRLSTKALRVVVVVSGVLLAIFALFNGSGYGNIGVGWTVAGNNLYGGLLRMLFSYSLGLLISRGFKSRYIRYSFLKASIILVALAALPHIGTLFSNTQSTLWLNGLYEMICVAIIFPFVLIIGASGSISKPRSIKACQFIGDLSYPLYITHYPFMYLFYHWIWSNEGLENGEIIPVLVLLPIGCIALAYLLLKLFDEPVRKRLSKIASTSLRSRNDA